LDERNSIIVQERERTQSSAGERAVLARVLLKSDEHTSTDAADSVELESADDAAQALEELAGLAKTAGAIVMSGLVQRRDRPDAGTFMGSGKVEELKRLVEHHDADVVIVDNNLSPAQSRNLEKALGVKVLDRTELILDIFATNARTYEARLAVDLAQMQYALPRLKQMWTHLSRIKMGIGMRGPGEKQLETDRRLVEKKIHDLREELREIEHRKERQVAARRDHMTVSLVGYTNAGKSTLMNALTDAGVLTANKLFATLDTRTRRWQLPHWGPVLISDTVGFIRDLPHSLIASFKATLEESRQADLLLHVADASNVAVYQQIASVYEVLEEIGIESKDILLALNKADLPRAERQLAGLMNRYPHAIPLSARSRSGLDALSHAVSDALSRGFADVDVETHVGNGKLLASLAASGEILSRRYEDDKVILHCRLPRRHLAKLPTEGVTVHERNSSVTMIAKNEG